MKAKGLKDVIKKRKPYDESLRHEQLSVIKEGLVSMISREKTERLSPRGTVGVGGPAKKL